MSCSRPSASAVFPSFDNEYPSLSWRRRSAMGLFAEFFEAELSMSGRKMFAAASKFPLRIAASPAKPRFAAALPGRLGRSLASFATSALLSRAVASKSCSAAMAGDSGAVAKARASHRSASSRSPLTRKTSAGYAVIGTLASTNAGALR
jgi:hypothetical protein